MKPNIATWLVALALGAVGYFAQGPAPDEAAYRRCIDQHHPARYCSREHLERGWWPHKQR